METSRKFSIVFLDRDGTIIVDKVYLNDPDGVEFIDGVIDGLKRLYQYGYKLVIVTNQSGIAKGLVQEENLHKIHQKIKDVLIQSKVDIFKIYYCPHSPEENCDCRKPKTGMVKEIIDIIDKEKSFVVGDKESDIEFGKTLGIKSILLSEKQANTKADFIAKNFNEAVEYILKTNK